jgi:lysophospholipase L1-like esterase
MKTRILVYGDSNTWGSDGTGIGLRYDTSEQWPNILSEKLGSEYEIVQEGLCARIAGNYDQLNTHRNGHDGYEISLRSASPFDYLIVALGSNDLKERYQRTAEDIVNDLLWYRSRTEEYNQTDADMEKRFKGVLYVGIAENRKGDLLGLQLAEDVRSKLREKNVKLIELKELSHSEDGLHYSVDDHKIVADEVLKAFKEYEDEV